MNNNFRTDEQIAETEERARANRVLMAKVYRNPRRLPSPAAVHGPLHRAIIAADLEAVRAALSATSVNQKTVGGLTPLHLAVFGYGQVCEKAQGDRRFVAGSKLVQEQIVDLLLSAGADVAAWDMEKRLPAACCEGRKMPESLKLAMSHMIDETTETTTLYGFHPNAFCTRGELLAYSRLNGH